MRSDLRIRILLWKIQVKTNKFVCTLRLHPWGYFKVWENIDGSSDFIPEACYCGARKN